MSLVVSNTITISRTVLTFGVLAGFGKHPRLDLALIPTIAFIIVLDAVDGYLARQRNETSRRGEMLDTLADRIIENSFWIYFTATGQLPVWMPIAVMTRGFLTDASQRLHGDPTQGWRYALTRSRLSRAVSGVSKGLAFVSLGSAMVFENATPLEPMSFVLAVFAVGVCLLRGLPFVFLDKRGQV